jgi:hypothetical protein
MTRQATLLNTLQFNPEPYQRVGGNTGQLTNKVSLQVPGKAKTGFYNCLQMYHQKKLEI